MTGATAFLPAATSGGINRDLRQEFLSLYPNRAQYIYRQSQDKSWVTSRFRLATGLIDAAISCESEMLFGAFFGDETRHAVLDIDKNSQYHNAQELERLRSNLADIGLSGNMLFQSSDSGGWHLYLPFCDPVPSKELERSLKAWLKALGYSITSGQLEVFPTGNALRLPLQRGFAWLDCNNSIIIKREKLILEAALSRFLLDFAKNANDWQCAKTLINRQLQQAACSAGGAGERHQKAISSGGFDELFSGGKIQENWDKGRRLWQEGLTEKGQRHDAVLFTGHYLWYGDAERGIAPLPGCRNDEYRAALIEDWLKEKHNGFCRHLSQDKWETISSQIKRAVLWRGDGEAREYEAYPLTDRLLKRLLAIFRKTGRVFTVEEFKKANDDRRNTARSKIQEAVSLCLTEGRQVSRKTLQALTGCSPNTLRCHGDLWKLFAAGSGVCNSGGVSFVSVFGSICSESLFLDRSSLIGDSGDLELEPVSEPPLDSKQQEDIKEVGCSLFQEDGNGNIAFGYTDGNYQKLESTEISREEQADFILPYGSQRRPGQLGSDSVPLRRLAASEVLNAGDLDLSLWHFSVPLLPSGAVDERRRHDSSSEGQSSSCGSGQTVYMGDFVAKRGATAQTPRRGAAALYRLVIDGGG